MVVKNGCPFFSGLPPAPSILPLDFVTFLSLLFVFPPSFSFDFLFGFRGDCLTFLFAVERAVFAAERKVVGGFAILGARVATHFGPATLVLAAIRWALRWEPFCRFAVLVTAYHIVVRVVVGFLTVLVPHFKIVHEFVLADFAVRVLH